MNTWIIGDVHSCGIELQGLIDQIDFSYKDNEYILVGDVLDRGKHAYMVWEIIKKYNIRVCLGNHEEKIIQYLSGKRDYLPKHYFSALNDLIKYGVKVEELYNWLLSLPLLIALKRKNKEFIITHAGVNLENPYKEDKPANVYANLSPENPMPQPLEHEKDKYWWDYYNKEPIVIYGHLVTHDFIPRIRRNSNKNINSIGIDTAIVHGFALTAYNLEKGIFVQYRSGTDWFAELKKDTHGKIIQPCLELTDFINKTII